MYNNYRQNYIPQIIQPNPLITIVCGGVQSTARTIPSDLLLRICSAHFEGGEKKDGDIPVPDPAVDKQLNIELPPKESKSGDRRKNKNSPPIPKSLVSRKRHVPEFLNCANDPSTSAVSPIVNDRSAPGLQDILSMSATRPTMNGPSSANRPLVALLDGRDCSVEMPLLKDVATVAFCDAQTTHEIHEKVLNEAVAALMYHSIKLEREDLMKFKALKIVVRIGASLDNIDVKAASELGIAVCHTPGTTVEETADFTFSLLLNLYKKTHILAKAVYEGKKTQGGEAIREVVGGSKSLRGETLGLIGLGRIGNAVALRARPFGMKIVFYDPYVPPGMEAALGLDRVSSLENLLFMSDVISLHCPLTEETRHILNAETMKHCRQGQYIINTSRGGLINENDLAMYLRSGHIRGAALDVHEQEPYDANILNPLAQCSSLVINTPHASWYTDSVWKDMRTTAAKEVRTAICNRLPHDLLFCVNKEAMLASNGRRVLQNIAVSQPGPSTFNPLANIQNFQKNFGFNGMPQFPYPNPLLAMGGMGLNPLLMNSSSALAHLAHTNPAAALSSLAAQTTTFNPNISPVVPKSPSPRLAMKRSASTPNGGPPAKTPSPTMVVESEPGPQMLTIALTSGVPISKEDLEKVANMDNIVKEENDSTKNFSTNGESGSPEGELASNGSHQTIETNGTDE